MSDVSFIYDLFIVETSPDLCIIIRMYVCNIYIAPIQLEAALRLFTILLSLTQTCFHPAHISTPKGAYNS